MKFAVETDNDDNGDNNGDCHGNDYDDNDDGDKCLDDDANG